MEYILQFARILGFCLAGEALHHLLPLPVPSSIYGLVLLFLALETGLLKVQQVKSASAWLISVFAVMFVPGTVGVMELWDVMARLLLPILLAVFVITALVFAVTGHVTQTLLFISGMNYQSRVQARRQAEKLAQSGNPAQAENQPPTGKQAQSGNPPQTGSQRRTGKKKAGKQKKEARK